MYNVYWIIISTWFVTLWYQEKNGHYPFLKPSLGKSDANQVVEEGSIDGSGSNGKGSKESGVVVASVSEIDPK